MSQAPATERERPLARVRVLDLTRFIAGPYCTMLLADQGAEVVKLEPPEGEVTRSLRPFIGAEDVSAYFVRYNRSKKSVCIDLRSESGLALAERLVRCSDVLVENFRPGVLDRLGLGWPRLQELNPRLVYCTITGFGHSESSLRERPAFTPIVEATSAAVTYGSRDGRPAIAGYPVGDIFPASLAVGAIAMALYRRERDGRGARIDIAMFDAMVSMNERAIAMTGMLGEEKLPGIQLDMGSSPAGLFAAPDGFITLAVVGEEIWQRFCAALGREDWAVDERLASGVGRGALYEEVVRPGIERWLAELGSAEAVRILNAAGVPAAHVLRPSEVIESEQAQARDMIVSCAAPGGVVARLTGNPIRFAEEQRVEPAPVPALGEHTATVLREWGGLDEIEIQKLTEAGVIAVRSPVAEAPR